MGRPAEYDEETALAHEIEHHEAALALAQGEHLYLVYLRFTKSWHWFCAPIVREGFNG